MEGRIMGTVSLKGVIDMHVHSAPDIRERAYTDFELMEAGIRVGARAIVIKSHHGTTMNRAFLVNEHNRIVHQGDNNFTMFGSVTLNNAIGGLNPVAVETGLKMGAKVVWLPTTHAANQIRKNGKTGGIECLDGGKVVAPLKEIFRLIKNTRCFGKPAIWLRKKYFPSSIRQANLWDWDKIRRHPSEFGWSVMSTRGPGPDRPGL
jgi:hypothetical protein